MFAVALFLVLERGKRIPRQSIVELVWPEVRNERRARQCLRQVLLKLRDIGLPITNQGDSVVLERSAVEADFETLTGVDPSPLVNGSRSSLEFLPGYSPHLSERFLDWVEQQRSRVHAGVQRLFVARIQQSRVRGDWREVDALAEECLRLDPYNEEAVMARAESAVMRGSKREALAILDGYMDALGPKVEAIGLPAKILRSRIAERLTEPRYAMLSEKHFVGRESSMELLNGLFRDARKGMGSGAFIWGPPGIGKSRLVQEIVNAGTLQGARVVSTKCQPSDVGRPLSAFADVVPPLRTLPGALGCSTQTVALLQRLTERDKTEVSSPVEPGDAEFLAATIRRAIFDLVDAVVDEGTLIMVVEDVHWLDATSWSILRAMVEWSTTKKLLILLTSRTAHPTQEKAADPDRGLHRHLLQPLVDADADSLLRLLPEGQDNGLPDSVRTWSIAAAEGNPYFLRELVTHWVETRQSFGVPRSLAALIDARLDRLSSLALRVLQFCAALAKHSTFERIERATGYRNHMLLDAVEELSGAGLLATEESEVRPRHDLLATAATARLGGAALKLVHRQVAAVLEAEVNERHAAGLMWDCAEHWHQAGESLHASSIVRACAAYLLDLGEPREAIELQEKVLAITTTAEDRERNVLDLANSLRLAGEWKRVGQLVTECFSKTDHALPPGAADELRLLALESDWRLGFPQYECLLRAVAYALDENISPLYRVKAAHLALILAGANGLRAEALTVHAAVSPLLSTLEDQTLAIQVDMIFHADYGSLDLAVDCARKLRAMEPKAGHSITYVRGIGNAALCLRRAGHNDEAKQILHEIFEFAETHAIAAEAAFAAQSLASLALQEQNFQDLRQWVDRGQEWISRDEEIMGKSSEPFFRGLLAIEDGDYESAQQYIARLTSGDLIRVGARPRQAWAMLTLYYQLAVNAELDQGVLKTLEVDFRTLWEVGHEDFPALVLVQSLRRVGRVADAKQVIQEYIHHRRVERSPLPLRLATAVRDLDSGLAPSQLD